MEDVATRLLVIGGGPGGYVAAIRAGQLGIPTVLVEDVALGGTCLNVGCIPSKALIHAADAFHEAGAHVSGSPFGLTTGKPQLDFVRTVGWKDGIVRRLTSGVSSLLKRAKVTVVRGTAAIIDGKTVEVPAENGTTRIRTEHLLLATGSQPAALRALPFGGKVIGSTEALSLPAVPARLAVVGAGYIGLELGTAFAKLGSAVTVIEAAGRVLPAWDEELTRPVAARLKTLGVEVLTGASAKGLSADGSGLLVVDANRDERTVPCDTALVAVGRAPRTAGFGLEKLDLSMNGPFIRVDDRCATSMRDVWAIGDVTGEPMLAHRAMAQGEMVAELIAGRKRRFDPVAVPAVCFTDPEIVSVGLSPAEAERRGGKTTVAAFPFAANGRAMTQGDDVGFVRVVAAAEDRLVLGIQAVGHGVSELAAAFVLALEMRARLEDVAATIQAHPTRGEALQEAALRALGHAIHI